MHLQAENSSQIKKTPRKNAIIVGASSGMGRCLAKILSKNGYTLGLTARRMPLLESLQKELPGKSFIKKIDVTQIEETQKTLNELISEMGGIDLMIISISSAYEWYLSTEKKQWEQTKKTLDVDGTGFICVAQTALTHFIKQNHGHLVGISSTSGLRGSAQSPVYSGVKAMCSTYLEAIRNKMIQEKRNITVTDIIPGFVAIEWSPLGTDPDAFWEATTEKACAQIYDAIKKKKKKAYITKRWRLVAWYYALAPDWLYNKIGWI